MICCCSLAGTAACTRCSMNPDPYRTNMCPAPMQVPMFQFEDQEYEKYKRFRERYDKEGEANDQGK